MVRNEAQLVEDFECWKKNMYLIITPPNPNLGFFWVHQPHEPGYGRSPVPAPPVLAVLHAQECKEASGNHKISLLNFKPSISQTVSLEAYFLV